MKNRHLLQAACALAIGLPYSCASAQDAYPNKPVKLVSPASPGGPTDVLARLVASALQSTLKQPFIVENKPGAGGNIGADFVAKSPADGYTVMIGIDTTVTVNPHIYKTLPFKASDLKPVIIMGSSGLMIGVNPSTGIKNMDALIAMGKSKGLNFSSSGRGSPGYLAAEILADVTKAKITAILYKGNAPAVTAVLSNEVDGGVLATPGLLPLVSSGKINAVAVTGAQRSKLAPDVPTVGELGMKKLELEILYLAMVPAATPDSVIHTLQNAIMEALKRPEVHSRLEALDLHVEPIKGTSAGERLAAMSERYARIVDITGMRVE